MSETFCLWAPWVFSALAAVLGWLLRGAYDDRKFKEYQALIKTKEGDVYHLNEAHNLLLHDKERKVTQLQEELAMKDRSIKDLNEQVEQSETSNRSLLSQVVEQKKKENRPSSTTPLPALVMTHGDDDLKNTFKSTSSSKRKRKKYKKKIKKFDQIIQELKMENQRLIDQAAAGAKETVEIIKEIPITITKTIIKRERINWKKLKSILKNIPMKKSKKVIKTKKKIGKPIIRK